MICGPTGQYDTICKNNLAIKKKSCLHYLTCKVLLLLTTKLTAKTLHRQSDISRDTFARKQRKGESADATEVNQISWEVQPFSPVLCLFVSVRCDNSENCG